MIFGDYESSWAAWWTHGGFECASCRLSTVFTWNQLWRSYSFGFAFSPQFDVFVMITDHGDFSFCSTFSSGFDNAILTLRGRFINLVAKVVVLVVSFKFRILPTDFFLSCMVWSKHRTFNPRNHCFAAHTHISSIIPTLPRYGNSHKSETLFLDWFIVPPKEKVIFRGPEKEFFRVNSASWRSF
jgi:hypothetical protein